jgi:hypothetical protein
MLETISIPILLKAIDFLFDEGRKILEERRERRKTQKESESTEATSNSPILIEPELKKGDDVIQTKETALATPVIKYLWKESEGDVTHLLKLLEIHTRNYRLAKEQYAKWGSALVPLIISNTLLEEEEAVATTIQKLQIILSRVYGKQVRIS